MMSQISTPKKTIEHDSGGYSPLSRTTRLLMTIGPLIGFATITVTTAWRLGGRAALFLLSMTVGTFLGGGKLIVFAGAIDGAPLSSTMLALLVVYGDLTTALIMIANMQYLYQIPLLGQHLVKMRDAGHIVLGTHKWMRRASWFGLALFVAVPFQGTGAVLGVFLGRILGLTRRAVITAIVTGSLVGAFSLATLGNREQQRIADIAERPVLALFVVVVCLTATFLLGRWFIHGFSRPKHGE